MIYFVVLHFGWAAVEEAQNEGGQFEKAGHPG